jgi:hypothetical protein
MGIPWTGHPSWAVVERVSAATGRDVAGLLTDADDPAVADLAARWARIAGSTDEPGFVANNAELISQGSTASALAILIDLYPGDGNLLHALEVAQRAAVEGIDATVTALAGSTAVVDVVRRWIRTRTWSESREFFHDQRQLLQSSEARALLSQSDRSVLRQHLAIVLLIDDNVEDPFTLAADPGAALEASHEAVRTGRPERLALLGLIAPKLASHPFHGALLRSGAAMAVGDMQKAAFQAAEAAHVGTVDQRRAAAARFRQLARRRNDLAQGASELARVLDPIP